MRYTTRILPEAEWGKLAQTDLPTVLPYVQPGTMQILVVEDGDRIVGMWAVWTLTHLEGLWIDPAYRHKPGVARRLKRETLQLAAQHSPWVMTAAQTPEIRTLLEHAGAVHIPGEMFVLNTERG